MSLPVTITVDPEHPSAEAFRGWLATLAARLDEHPEPMRLVIDTRNRANRGYRMDIAPDGRFVISSDGCRDAYLDLRGRWIADHPIPLDLGHRRTVLHITPTDGNRFRVGAKPIRKAPIIPIWGPVALCAAATVSAMTLNPLWLVPGLLCLLTSIIASRRKKITIRV